MRCGERIPPESLETTEHKDAKVKVWVRVKQYKGLDEDKMHSWTYNVDFINDGLRRVRLLSHHIIFTDMDGRVDEVKRQGSRNGLMFIMEPGTKASYSASAALFKDTGSMHGSFQFEILPPAPPHNALAGAPAPPPPPLAAVSHSSFSATIGRLSLSVANRAVAVPCVPVAGEDESGARVTDDIPPTSIWFSESVATSLVVRFVEKKIHMGVLAYVFSYDLHVTNAREKDIIIVARRWEAIDNVGNLRVDEGAGLNEQNSQPVGLFAGGSMYHRGGFSLPTPTGNYGGVLLVRLNENSEALTLLRIAKAGCSADSSPVPVFPLRPHGYQEPLFSPDEYTGKALRPPPAPAGPKLFCPQEKGWSYLFELEDNKATVDMPSTAAGVAKGFRNANAYYAGNAALNKIDVLAMRWQVCSGLKSSTGCSRICHEVSAEYIHQQHAKTTATAASQQHGLTELEGSPKEKQLKQMLACFTGQCAVQVPRGQPAGIWAFFNCGHQNEPKLARRQIVNKFFNHEFYCEVLVRSHRPQSPFYERFHYYGWGLTMYTSGTQLVTNELSLENPSKTCPGAKTCTQLDVLQIRYRPI